MAARLKQNLSCPVCCEIFKDPLLLSCSHSVCKACLEQFWEGQAGPRECPVCRTAPEDWLPPNLALKTLCEAFSQDWQHVTCKLHRRKVEFFCEEDQQLVCQMCRGSLLHREHSLRSIGEAAVDVKEELMVKLQDRLKAFERAKATCDETAEYIKTQAHQTEIHIKLEFAKLHRFLRDEEAARIAALREEEEQKSQMMKEKIEKMSREIASLSDTIRATEEEMEVDDITFLQNYKSTVERVQSSLQDPEVVSGALISVAKHLGNLRFRVWVKMQEIAEYTPVILDPNTAADVLTISKDLTAVSATDEDQQLPDNQERFEDYANILASEGFDSGTHSWDVEVGESTWWFLGVMAESLPRKGDFNAMPGRWYLCYDDGKFGAESPPLPASLVTVRQKPQTIRVTLDWDRGTLSFCDLDSNTRLHTIKHTFTEKVFPYFAIGCKLAPLQILPAKVSVTVELRAVGSVGIVIKAALTDTNTKTLPTQTQCIETKAECYNGEESCPTRLRTRTFGLPSCSSEQPLMQILRRQRVMMNSPHAKGQVVKGKVLQSTTKPSSSTASEGVINLKTLFAKKEGEWDCDVCCVRNASASKTCVSCQTPNPNTSKTEDKPWGEPNGSPPGTTPAAGFTFGITGEDAVNGCRTNVPNQTTDDASAMRAFSFPFAKKEGEWDCPTCCVRNTASSSSCVSCQTANSSHKIDNKEPKGSSFSFGSSSGSGFGALFARKEGEWDCPTCCVRNTASSSSCVSCQTANSSHKIDNKEPKGSSFSFGSSSGSGFGALFARKEGEWDCPTCCVRNTASLSSCVACQTVNPSPKIDNKEPQGSPFSFGSSSISGFGAQFARKEGEWDCPTCCVRNTASSSSCVSCQTANPSHKIDNKEPKGSSFSFGSSSGSGFGALFARKEGDWDCPTCCVRNTASLSSCVACQTVNTSHKIDNKEPKGSPFSFGSSSISGFGAQFARKEGDWDCPTCCVRNTASSSSCVSCQTANPSHEIDNKEPKGSSFSFGSSSVSGLGALFARKEGDWDCPTCCVRNTASSRSVACQTENPSNKIDNKEPKGSPFSSGSSSVSGFGAQFGRREGEWDCDVCCIRNASSSKNCVACQTPRPNI